MSIPSHQLFVCATFHNPTLVHHQNSVRVPDRGKTVCHHKGGASTLQLFQRRLHQLLGLAVECGGRLIQQQDGSILQNGTRNGDALPLSTGKLTTPLSNRGFVSLWQFPDESIRLRSPCGRVHLLFGRARVPTGDVFTDGSLKQIIALRHIGGLCTQGSNRPQSYLRATEFKLPRGKRIQPHQETNERALPAAAATDKRNGLSRKHCLRNVTEHILPGFIPKTHVLQLHNRLL